MTKVDLSIHYARANSSSPQSPVRVSYIHYNLDLSNTSAFSTASAWVSRLLDRAYRTAQRKKRIKLIINPYGGAGKAVKICQTQVEPIFAAARCEVDIEKTTHVGHAGEIANALDIDKYDVVAAASGDGVAYEIFNGLGKKLNAVEALSNIAVVQIPCGTGNAMSWNLCGTADPSLAALAIVKGIRTPLDLMSLTQGEDRKLTFLSQSVGIVAESDLGTDNIRWMGETRFVFGFFMRVLGKTQYPCEIAFKTVMEDKAAIRRTYAREVVKRRRVPLGRRKDATSATGSSPSPLPPLRHGTILDPIPDAADSLLNDSTSQESPDPSWTPLTSYPHLGSFYAGNMCFMAKDAPFFPSSIPNDGLMDICVTPGDCTRRKAISLLLSVPKNKFFDDEAVQVKKVVAYRLIPKFGRHSPAFRPASGKARHQGDGYVSVDGEVFPFEPFQVEIHQSLGTVLSKNGVLYETPGPRGWEAYLPEVEQEIHDEPGGSRGEEELVNGI